MIDQEVIDLGATGGVVTGRAVIGPYVRGHAQRRHVRTVLGLIVPVLIDQEEIVLAETGLVAIDPGETDLVMIVREGIARETTAQEGSALVATVQDRTVPAMIVQEVTVLVVIAQEEIVPVEIAHGLRRPVGTGPLPAIRVMIAAMPMTAAEIHG